MDGGRIGMLGKGRKEVMRYVLPVRAAEAGTLSVGNSASFLWREMVTMGETAGTKARNVLFIKS